jgi:hypothetical protein
MDPSSELVRIKIEGDSACFQLTEAKCCIKALVELNNEASADRIVYSEVIKRGDMDLSSSDLILELDFSTSFTKKRSEVSGSGRYMVSTFMSKS